MLEHHILANTLHCKHFTSDVIFDQVNLSEGATTNVFNYLVVFKLEFGDIDGVVLTTENSLSLFFLQIFLLFSSASDARFAPHGTLEVFNIRHKIILFSSHLLVHLITTLCSSCNIRLRHYVFIVQSGQR